MKTEIRFLVQDRNEFSAEYAERLMVFVNQLPDPNPTIIPTSASDGRMTTMITWKETEIKERVIPNVSPSDRMTLNDGVN
jgi:hypothetical protein